MTKRMVLYEAAKILLLFVELVCVVVICFGVFLFIRFVTRLGFAMSPFTYDQMMNVADSVPDKLSIVRRVMLLFISRTTKEDAIAGMLRYLRTSLHGYRILTLRTNIFWHLLRLSSGRARF